MRKKCLILALAAALPTAALAQSQVTLYGDMELAILASKTFANGGNDMKTVSRVDDTGSLIGVKGSEALGNGLSAIWQVESYISADGTNINGGSNSNKLGSRDTFVGLQGGWGKVRLGRLSSYLNSDMETLDTWQYAWTTGTNGLGILIRYDGRHNSSIRYDSPVLAGFDFSLLYSADETRNNGDNQFTWGVGLGYTASHCFVKAGFVQFQEQNDNGDKDGYFWRVEGGYQDTLSLIFAYQQSKQYGEAATGGTDNIWMRPTADASGYLGASGIAFGNNDKLKTQEAAMTVSYQWDNFIPRISFVWGDDAKLNGNKLSDSGYQQYIAGVDYQFSKRTMLYTSYGLIHYDSSKFTDGQHDKEYSLAVGMLHLF
jgi:Outer membrane protein (porin)